MPELDTPIHIEMLRDYKRRMRLPIRLARALKRELFEPAIYGLEWGDPEVVAPLGYLRDTFLTPHVHADHAVLEIGPGGGRWTRYMLEMREIWLVDYHKELLEQLKANYNQKNMHFVHNGGDDFPGVPDHSIDFLWSFGVFVHLDANIIKRYLVNMKRVVVPGGNIVLQYGDKTKPMAKNNPGFADNDPERMRAMVQDAGFTIVEEDNDTLWHSAMIRFQP